MSCMKCISDGSVTPVISTSAENSDCVQQFTIAEFQGNRQKLSSLTFYDRQTCETLLSIRYINAFAVAVVTIIIINETRTWPCC